MAELSIKGINKSFSKKQILKGFSLECRNEILFLAGKNGAGKTTLLRLALELDKDYTGLITYGGNAFHTCRSRVGVVFDEPHFYSRLSGRDNIDIFAPACKKDKDYYNKVMNDLQMDQHLLGQKVSEYSLGQRHRLAVALAIMNKPDYLFLDEPTIGLDPISWQLVRQCIIDIKNRNGAVIITGQDYSEMQKLADKMVILHNGSAAYSGSVDDLIEKFPYDIRIESKQEMEEGTALLKEKEKSTLGNTIYTFSVKKQDVNSFIDHMRTAYTIESLEVNKIGLREAFLKVVGEEKACGTV